jgi:NADH:ubiquinone oxidoreductase subunit 5 (subunit L)/multisubunit Na+/H+ antiporter MnhA subunit
MNKLTVVIAAIVLAALVGIPPVIGSFTEQRIMAQAERLETMTDSAYSFEVLEYEGGWFEPFR